MGSEPNLKWFDRAAPIFKADMLVELTSYKQSITFNNLFDNHNSSSPTLNLGSTSESFGPFVGDLSSPSVLLLDHTNSKSITAYLGISAGGFPRASLRSLWFPSSIWLRQSFKLLFTALRYFPHLALKLEACEAQTRYNINWTFVNPINKEQNKTSNFCWFAGWPSSFIYWFIHSLIRYPCIKITKLISSSVTLCHCFGFEPSI